MNTVIEVQHKNYTENVIVTEGNFYEVIDLLNESGVVDFTVVVEGDIDIFDKISECDYIHNFNASAKVKTINKWEVQATELEEAFATTDREAISNREKAAKIRARISERTLLLNNIEQLFI
jgi:L-rhamnose mutarotase